VKTAPHLAGEERRSHLDEIRVPQLAAGIRLPQHLKSASRGKADSPSAAYFLHFAEMLKN
jgi:hypothetical protein